MEVLAASSAGQVNRAHEGLTQVHRLAGATTAAIQRAAHLRRALLKTAFSGRLTGASSDAEVIEEMAGM